MVERSGVFLLNSENVLVGMEPAEFVTENEFQSLLERFPDLLVGDQVDPTNPRKWILVKREQTVSTGDLGASLWSVDHVFLDQDGIPTLVEIKRQSDSRGRREVVGQMLDYAASCSTYWSVESLQSELERTCQAAGKSVEQALEHLLDDSASVEEFWRRVKVNLQSRNIRLLFVADHIPTELRRIVEFLNEEMSQVEVLAIELRQFTSNNLRAIVPTVYGQTQAAVQKRAAGRAWDESLLFDKLRATVDEQQVVLGRQIFDWMRQDGRRQIKFGTGQTDGSVYPLLRPSGVTINPVYLSSGGKLYFQFGALQNKPVFGTVEKKRALMERINQVQNVGLTDVDLMKFPGVPLKTITKDPDGPKKIMSALRWIDEEIEMYESQMRDKAGDGLQA